MRTSLLVVIPLLMAGWCDAESTHPLDAELLPAVKALWPILTAASSDASHEKEGNAEEFAGKVAPVMKDLVRFTPEQCSLISRNKPIRKPGTYEAWIKARPPELWNEKSKKMLQEWYADEAHSVARREAMFFLLQLVVPKPDKANKSE